MDNDCRAANSKSGSRAEARTAPIFFPYNCCLAFRVLDVSPHTTYEFHGDDAVLDVKVKIVRVLRDSMRNARLASGDTKYGAYQKQIQDGDTITFCLRQNSTINLKHHIDSLRGKTQVWAFSSRSEFDKGKRLFFDFEERYEPFRNRTFTSTDLTKLATALGQKALTAQDANVPIEAYLKSRWTENRARDYCRRDDRLYSYGAYPDPNDFKNDGSAFKGMLYSNPDIGQVIWEAEAENGVPTYYGLVAKWRGDVWQLERTSFNLNSTYSDDDVLKKRIFDTLNIAFEESFDRHKRQPTKSELDQHRAMRYSSTPLSLPSEWSAFAIERAPKGRQIVAVFVDGKKSEEWSTCLAESKQKISRFYAH